MRWLTYFYKKITTHGTGNSCSCLLFFLPVFFGGITNFGCLMNQELFLFFLSRLLVVTFFIMAFIRNFFSIRFLLARGYVGAIHFYTQLIRLCHNGIYLKWVETVFILCCCHAIWKKISRVQAKKIHRLLGKNQLMWKTQNQSQTTACFKQAIVSLKRVRLVEWHHCRICCGWC